MRVSPPVLGGERPSLRGVSDGWNFARSRPELIGTYLVDIIAMVSGMPEALFPAIAETLGGAAALGLPFKPLPSNPLSLAREKGQGVRVEAPGLTAYGTGGQAKLVESRAI